MSAPINMLSWMFKLSVIVILCNLSSGLGLDAVDLDEDNLPDIAVIGGGIGGVSTAYTLRKLFGDKANIDLFESKQIGGRISTVVIDGREYESGASIIHPRNQYMVNFTKQLGLRKRDGHSGKLGIYDGQEFLFTGSHYSLITMAKMFWRYGMDIYNIDSWINDLLAKFDRIYQHQADGIAFSTVEGLLESMDPSFVDFPKTTIREMLKKDGYSDRFIDELVTAGMRVNYGQGPDIHAFAGMVGLAGVLPGMWSVHGGNRLVPEKLLEAAKVNFLNAEVTNVKLERDESNNARYDLKFTHSDMPEGAEPMFIEKRYDIVVVATPLHQSVSDITFTGFPKPIHYMPEPYHRTLANFAQGFPNTTHFGTSDVPTSILCNNLDLFFNALAKHCPVDRNPQFDAETKWPVWKAFSSAPLSTEQLSQLFDQHKNIKVIDWLAYPEYQPMDSLPSFVLYDQLYYVNSIELAASAMEMSCIGGRNVATLAYNHWYGLFEKIDEFKEDSETIVNTETESNKVEL